MCRRIAAKSSNSKTVKEYQAKYRAANREKRNLEKKTWYAANKDRKLKRDKENKTKDIAAFRARQNKYWKNRYNSDPQYKLRKLLRASLRRGLFSGQKSILEYLDCTLDELRTHIESQFMPQMSWSNHGKIWDIDHVEPLCSFDLTDETQIRLATRKVNLRPLIKQLNSLKSKEDRKCKRS